MEMFRCYGCMQMIAESVCPYCGHPAGGQNAACQLPVGTVLADRYLVGRAVRQTDTAIVYIALDRTQDRSVHLCEYYPAADSGREGTRVLPGPGFAPGFEAQSRNAAALISEPNLARVSGTLDAFEENGTVYLVQEQNWGPGMELYIRRRGGMLEAQEALRILHELVGALAVLHQSGGAHGSIHMGQLALDPMGGARLLGFGEVPGNDPGEDVLAVSRAICDCIAPGAEISRIPGLKDQQRTALTMGTCPDKDRRFSSAAALRRALYGDVTFPMPPLAPLKKYGDAPALPEQPPVEEIPVIPAAPEMPRTEAITSEVLSASGQQPPEEEIPVIPVIPVAPEMPRTEAITSEALSAPSGQPAPEAEPPFPVPGAEPPFPVPGAEPPFPVRQPEAMPATELITDFKVELPPQSQPQPQPAAAAEPAPQPPEMPRTEAAPVVPPQSGWDVPPQWPAQSQWPAQPQWPEQPPQPPKKKKTGLVVGIIAGVVLALVAVLVICYLFVHIWEDATCETPKTCTICGKTEGDVRDHKWESATCTDPEYCRYCGETQGEALGHQWSPATCEDPKLCSRCGAAEGDPLPHSWINADCETPRTCSVCGTTEGSAAGHSWVDATCESPKTCSVCGKTEGKALGHSWKDATYTAPRTCSRCGATDGVPKGYMEYIDGEFNRFYWGNSYTDSYTFETPVKGCTGFTLYYEPTFYYNTWVDEWKLLYQDTNGTWHEYCDFKLNTTTYEHVFTFSPKLNVKAVAVIPRINGSYSYSFSLGVWDLYYTN